MSSKENADYLLQQAMNAGIRNPKELANFMGQMQVESGNFVRMDENFHYSGARLLAVFRGRNGMKTIKDANAIAAKKPEEIADALYGGEWGKRIGNTQVDDGWNYHGRGYVQLTGRDLYTFVGKALGLDLVNHPELAADREIAAKIAIYYWQSRVVKNGDQQDVINATYDINTAGEGLPERIKAAAAWEKKLVNGYQPGQAEHPSLVVRLRLGAHGPDVVELQSQLDQLGYRDIHGHRLHLDGHFGPGMQYALEAFQRDHGLTANGFVDSATGAKLLAFPKHRTQSDSQSVCPPDWLECNPLGITPPSVLYDVHKLF
jgi:putative chitinase